MVSSSFLSKTGYMGDSSYGYGRYPTGGYGQGLYPTGTYGYGYGGGYGRPYYGGYGNYGFGGSIYSQPSAGFGNRF